MRLALVLIWGAALSGAYRSVALLARQGEVSYRPAPRTEGNTGPDGLTKGPLPCNVQNRPMVAFGAYTDSYERGKEKAYSELLCQFRRIVIARVLAGRMS